MSDQGVSVTESTITVRTGVRFEVRQDLIEDLVVMSEDVSPQIMVIFTDLTTLETLSSSCAIGVPAPSQPQFCLVDRHNVFLEILHRGGLVAAVVTRRVAGMVLLVIAQGRVVMKHLGADITDIVFFLFFLISFIYFCKK